MKFVKIKQKHIGSDRLREVIRRFQEDLENRGVEFNLSTTVKDLKYDRGRITEVETSKGTFPCDYVIWAPGRKGSLNSTSLYDRLGLKYFFNPIDIGVRVEFPSSLMREIVEEYECWDPKVYIRTPTFDDKVRTFCTCPYGYVTIESYEDSLRGVNGYSKFKKWSDNTNFALLVTVGLTQPLNDTTEYGRRIAHVANILGGGKPLLQRYGDLRRGRRSKPESIKENHVKPTLSLDEVTPGDIGLAYPYRLVLDIKEELEKLNNIIPGIAEDSTLLYGPEVKFYSRRIETVEKKGFRTLQTSIQNLFVAGDGSGYSRGIVGAAWTGIIAARGIKSLD
ncbi:MAG: FAD-dependent oxidoreductase [Candidatus Aenigmarchaeota archaeon]|nr:FAD-dependent oxidoreductase [Candidatus Aenigmarchaeota archaeon]